MSQAFSPAAETPHTPGRRQRARKLRAGPGWDAQGNLARPEQFKSWLDNVIVPYINHCRSKGLYVILVGNPSEVFPPGNDGKPAHGRNMTQQYQANLIKFWTEVASHPSIKSADNVHFEICNEPVNIETTFGKGDWRIGDDAHWAAITNFMQPVVDAIRAQGADNIIWIPGLGWQGQYAGFAKYPVSGGNVGYAAHQPTAGLRITRPRFAICGSQTTSRLRIGRR